MVCRAEQVIGCERETAILFGNLRGYFRRAWRSRNLFGLRGGCYLWFFLLFLGRLEGSKG